MYDNGKYKEGLAMGKVLQFSTRRLVPQRKGRGDRMLRMKV